MYMYSQSSGTMWHNGTAVATGYSGNGEHKNVPADQNIIDKGPLPRGLYLLGTAITDPHLGPIVISLTPDSFNDMFGRSAFYIHGDSILHPGQASCGCIVLPNAARQYIASHTDKILQVTS